MKKLILILVLFVISEAFPQVTSPSSYTTNYRFRKWVQGANPSADSLNANWDLADAKIKLAYDSAQTKVNTYGNQTIKGTKTFPDSAFIGELAISTYLFLGGYRLYSDPFGFLTYNTDTVATLNDVRAGALSTINLSGDATFGADVRYTGKNITVTSSTISAVDRTYIKLSLSGNYDITSISGGSDGKIIYIQNGDLAFTITIREGIDNINSAGDFVMGYLDTITLIYDATQTVWIELSRSNN